MIPGGQRWRGSRWDSVPFGFPGGFQDVPWEPEEVYWASEEQVAGDKRFTPASGISENPLGAVQMG